jgi:hypothetical protein
LRSHCKGQFPCTQLSSLMTLQHQEVPSGCHSGTLAFSTFFNDLQVPSSASAANVVMSSPRSASPIARSGTQRSKSISKPINILRPSSNNNGNVFEAHHELARTAPAHIHITSTQRQTCQPSVCGFATVSSPFMSKPRVIFPQDNNTPRMSFDSEMENENNEALITYRQRVLNEAIRRMYGESDKENSNEVQMCSDIDEHRENRHFGQSLNGLEKDKTSQAITANAGLKLGNVTESISSCSTFTDFWEDTDDEEDELMPRGFNSIGDIIGYAKVVRSQRNEALGQLNNAMNKFDDAFARMRKELEERRLQHKTVDGGTSDAA